MFPLLSLQQPSQQRVVEAAHHSVVGGFQPGGEGCQLIRCEYIDAPEGFSVSPLLTIYMGAPLGRGPWHGDGRRMKGPHGPLTELTVQVEGGPGYA